MPKFKSILLFGAPGVGKGTQGKILGMIPGYYHCSCGDVFRNIDIKSELGKVFSNYSARGELVPDEFTIKLWAESIDGHNAAGNYKPSTDLLLLDGIPRTAEQAKLLKDHIDVLQVIYLTCSDEEAMFERLRRRAVKENRLDDADDKVIRNRWDVYERETQPVLDCYPKDLIGEVDAIGTPARIFRDVRTDAPQWKTS